MILKSGEFWKLSEKYDNHILEVGFVFSNDPNIIEGIIKHTNGSTRTTYHRTDLIKKLGDNIEEAKRDFPEDFI